jgi:Ser/Thr protein kinase RdoA (MazF antagonist)
MSITPEENLNLKAKIQECLGKEITRFTLKGRGACNDAYYVETREGGHFIVKQERAVKEFQPQNSLMVEAAVAQQFYGLGLSIPIPRVVFVSENPPMYGYEYIEGQLMKEVWPSLSEEERVNICFALGRFHAEIGKKVSREMSQELGVKIDESSDLHPEVLEEYIQLMEDESVPAAFKALVERAKALFDRMRGNLVFQFLHNDAHHENILIQDKKISGFIDFGNTEYGEIAKEFSRYIRDFPEYFTYIMSAYEEESGRRLSYERLVSNALLSGFMEIVEDYWKGGEGRAKAEESIATYDRLMDQFTKSTPARSD